MDFHYYSYQDDLFKKISDQTGTLFLFDSYSSMQHMLQNYYNPSFLQGNSIFITIEEFRERILADDSILLKEEKLPILLYSVLTEEEKEELKISSYQDIYSFSSQFFRFFRMLEEYQVEQLKSLADWQQERYTLLTGIRQRFEQKMNKLNCKDKTMLYRNEINNINFIKDMKRIVFVNTAEFSPLFKKTLNSLQKYCKIELHLQLEEEDFDEKNLQLKQLNYPALKNFQQKIKIYESSDELKELAGVLSIEEGADNSTDIIDCREENSNFKNLLNSSIDFAESRSIKDTALYHFLTAFYEVYLSAFKKGNIKLNLKSVLDFVNIKMSSKILELEEDSYYKLVDLYNDDYFYLNRDIIEAEIPVIYPLFAAVEKLKSISSLKELTAYITKIVDFPLESKFLDLEEKFFDTVIELNTAEDMNLHKNWYKYFADKAGGFFRLFLDYLGYKSLRTENEDRENRLSWSYLSSSPTKKRASLILTGCTQSNMSVNSSGFFFLNEKQLSLNKLPTSEDKYLLKKYRFLRHVFNAEKVSIFTINNREENIYPASVLEELKMNYDIEFKQNKFKNIDESDLLKNFFNLKNSGDNNDIESDKADGEIPLVRSDFREQFSITFYKYSQLKRCFYRFYLEQILHLQPGFSGGDNSLSFLSLGILVHQSFSNLTATLLEGSNFSEKKAEEIIFGNIKKLELKIDEDLKPFYKNIMTKKIAESFKFFWKEMSNIMTDENTEVLIEWPSKTVNREIFLKLMEVEFYLSGRIDLLLMGENADHIIDFKTGSGDKLQLDFYNLMLRENSADKDISKKCKKAIYSVFEKKFDLSYRNREDELFLEIKKLLKELFEKKEFSRISSYDCDRCPYYDFCRVDDKI
ncbi:MULTISPECIES: PD-(D/E)XK nuclease family protein [unclassified Halanaerobium]|uniref:PD-(D/E)XK nuclease family protein n=1 Tax=unclassified Halanaerobium TaxID=2641197 RepID=UPI000DF42BAD|nr:MULTISPECIES: PD-(D/E)XK nuclease family protein [unclassified Halanaerobium]RCW48789.1 PD-(D/E)XK nuclease superfamily protein [Halanaerobium sp. MA284_MarDTE_T2]RCW89131.1 PD-(D/E)XK nuclease superfamily protein [Halanaerobium sp. DL-01]